MTSFTRKLYNSDPVAAEAFHRHSRFDKSFAHLGREEGYGFQGRLTAPVTFGQRLNAVTIPVYLVWSPELGETMASAHRIAASDSFAARQVRARRTGKPVSDFAARREGATF